MKYTLRKYIDIKEVFNRVSSSLKSYSDSDMIIFDSYYHVIDLCNAQLGMRLNPTKEAFLSISNYKTELPEDFLQLELALLVGKNVTIQQIGNKVTETLTGECTTDDVVEDKCCKFSIQCGKKTVLTCETETEYIEFDQCYFARLTENKYATSNCINLNINSQFSMEIKDGILYTDNQQIGNIYLNYVAKMNNKDNIPTCLDHPIVLQYYVDALKYEILKDLYINKRLDIVQAIPLIEKDYIKSKNAAISLVSTPEFGELISINNAIKRDYRRKNYYIY